MTPLYPLRFRPIVRRYIWGGRRLESCLGKALGPGNDHAESWEICDHGADQSVVEHGPLAGATLGELVRGRGRELLGRAHPQERFPLLLKFLDAARMLSVQVHPNDEQAALQSPPDLGKTEAWVVLAAEPGSQIYAGLRPGVDRRQLTAAIAAGRCEELLHGIEPRAGDCLFIPAGTVHALGGGVLVAEIQQSSDTTFRLFDWNRVGADGKPRTLHVEQALTVVDFARGPIRPQRPRPTDRPWASRLVDCEKFVLDRWEISGRQAIGGDGRFHILCVLEGGVRIDGDPHAEPLVTGGTILLPACAGSTDIEPLEKTVLLNAFVP